MKRIVITLLLTLALPGLASNVPEQPRRNPWLNESVYPISHHNPAQNDVSIAPGPTVGKKLSLEESFHVPLVWCSAPTVKTINGYTAVIAANPHGIIKIDATDGAFDQISNVAYPGWDDINAAITPEKIDEVRSAIDKHRRAKNDWRLLFNAWWAYIKLKMNVTTASSGAYGMIDKDGYHYASFDRLQLVKSFDGNIRNEPMRPVKHTDLRDQLPKDVAAQVKTILGLNLTYDGHIVAAATGALFVVDRELNLVDYKLFPGEHVENSVAVDERGIYLVTSKRMHHLVWTGEKLSDDESLGAWSSAYEVMPEGEAWRTGAASHGSGTTPTLMGFGDDEDHLVVISDGRAEGTQLVAFWRDAIPDDFAQKAGTSSRRIADQITIAISKTTIEASPAVYGYGVAVVNSSYPQPTIIPRDLLGNGLTAGITREPPRGLEKFQWNPQEDRFEQQWLRADIDNTDWMPPAISLVNGLAYIAHKQNGVYEYQAVEWDTGKTVARWEFPDDSVRWNTWGGITTLLADGDLLLGGFFGVKRFDTGNFAD
ncbi:MAG TPA: hypothetical protein DIW43_16505 [Spongiibacteraceae bacterium]|nr:hypothetical protein [Spongiibacteraceae bacterium]MBN51926.1 hypothetical protein [Spongiibacteraceae bacterium]HCS29060.1 hypothetical protein [Spongiibacteraceae bacterium]